MRTSQKTAGIITTIGIDLGKNTFHLVGFDDRVQSSCSRRYPVVSSSAVWPIFRAA
jgi:hypothetical protein